MSKSLINQRHIYKNTSSRYKEANWDLNLSVEDAKKNNEIVSVNDSIALRMIRDITNQNVTEEEINEIKEEIKKLKRKSKSKANTTEIEKLYEQLEEKILIKDLNSIVFESISDWNFANKKKNKVKLNGVERKRIIGTSGGVKKNTVLFCNNDIHTELERRLNNDRNPDAKCVPAKFESYKALAFSGSIPVTQPKGVLVIEDGEIDIYKEVLLLSDDGKGGFNLSKEDNYHIKRAFTDGCSMISKELADQWTMDMGFYKLDKNDKKIPTYTASGFNIRNAYCKGMVFTFPYVEFAEEVAIPSGKSYFVKDAWGNEQDLRKVDLILTTNMLKLWYAYDSVEHYLESCKKNGFEFCVAKILPKKLENTRNMNYQFLESYELADEEIRELVRPTIESIKGALSEDYLKMILFLKGCKLSEDDFINEEMSYLKALMIDERIKNDPFIRKKVYRMIEKKMNDAKKGTIEVSGSYQIVSGDLYAQCQYMYGLEVTGLLKENEFFSQYWNNRNVKEIVSFRAPMTVHNNIKKMKLVNSKQVNKWFKYMKTCLVINAFDTTMDAMNGEDFDSDANICTNNKVLLDNTRDELAIICEQKTAKKDKITEKLLRQSNKNGFGNNVGSVTNKCTSMYDVLSKFEKGSKEYDEMMYRIICMQGYQQEIIDSIKGIIPKKVPKHWYDYQEVKINKDDTQEIIEEKLYNQKLLADKKPYFFIYNYKALMAKYNRFVKDSNVDCFRLFQMSVEELEQKQNKTDEEKTFLEYYNSRMPVSMEKSLMNRLCWTVEDELRDINLKIKNNDFDYSFLKTDDRYTKTEKSTLKQILKSYKTELKMYSEINYQSEEEGDSNINPRSILIEKYQKEVFSVCNNEDVVCNILIDLCGKNDTNKQFLWDICGDVLIERMLQQHNYEITIPVVSRKVTNTYWQGDYYKAKKINIQEVEKC